MIRDEIKELNLRFADATSLLYAARSVYELREATAKLRRMSKELLSMVDEFDGDFPERTVIALRDDIETGRDLKQGQFKERWPSQCSKDIKIVLKRVMKAHEQVKTFYDYKMNEVIGTVPTLEETLDQIERKTGVQISQDEMNNESDVSEEINERESQSQSYSSDKHQPSFHDTFMKSGASVQSSRSTSTSSGIPTLTSSHTHTESSTTPIKSSFLSKWHTWQRFFLLGIIRLESADTRQEAIHKYSLFLLFMIYLILMLSWLHFIDLAPVSFVLTCVILVTILFPLAKSGMHRRIIYHPCAIAIICGATIGGIVSIGLNSHTNDSNRQTTGIVLFVLATLAGAGLYSASFAKRWQLRQQIVITRGKQNFRRHRYQTVPTS